MLKELQGELRVTRQQYCGRDKSTEVNEIRKHCVQRICRSRVRPGYRQLYFMTYLDFLYFTIMSGVR